MKKLGVLLFVVLCFSFIYADTIWNEDFSSYSAGSGINGYGNIGDYPSGVSKWTLDVSGASLSGTGDYVKTVSGKLEVCDTDGNALWISQSIDISGNSNVSFSVTISESGDLESTDYADVYYSLNGGTYQMITNWENLGNTVHTLIGDKPNDNDWQSKTVSKTGLNADNLQIKVRMKINAGTEKIQIDNIIVEGDTSAPDYYASISPGLTGSALKSALHNLIDNHTPFTYNTTSSNNIMMEADEDPNNSSRIIEIYTGDSESSISSREHVWAKSHGDFGTSRPTGADIHNLKPCQFNVNSTRGNKDFDDGGSEVSSAPGNYHDSDSWEPRDEVKGDVARILFYMAVRYEGDVSGEPDLELVNGVNTEDATISGIYGEHGNLNAALQWHLDDPVDDFEMNRNDVIHQHQLNRNPFIDHPEWVFEIWDFTTEPEEGNIIISEICDPKYNYRYDRFIEICNVGGSDFSLDGWKVVAVGNGTDKCTWNLSGNITAGEALTCGTNNANISIDFESSSWYGANTSWNGKVNDGAKLLNGSEVVDIVIASGNLFNDKTLVRNSTVLEPSGFTTEYSEWSASSVRYAYNATPGSHSFGRSYAQAPVINGMSGTIYNYPNPFNPSTTFSFSLNQNHTGVTVSIYNIKGERVTTVFSGDCKSNKIYQATWDGTDLNNKNVVSGVYYSRLKAGNFSQVRKILLVK